MAGKDVCADDYTRLGVAFIEARELLELGCEIPPSLEVFRYELLEIRKQDPSLNPQRVAAFIASSYRRIQI